MKKDKAVPESERRRSGFLPYLSDNLPINGVAKNWKKEKIAKSIPFSKSFKPNCREYE
jgi:hypothetical protein